MTKETYFSVSGVGRRLANSVKGAVVTERKVGAIGTHLQSVSLDHVFVFTTDYFLKNNQPQSRLQLNSQQSCAQSSNIFSKYMLSY